MKFLTLTLLLTSTLAITACGTSKQDRALSGAGIGAAAGAVGGAVVGGSVAGAALVGAGAGAVIGSVTDEDQIDLDK